jgi:hypothetical protein
MFASRPDFFVFFLSACCKTLEKGDVNYPESLNKANTDHPFFILLRF